jgi:hypothetical protein
MTGFTLLVFHLFLIGREISPTDYIGHFMLMLLIYAPLICSAKERRVLQGKVR